MAITLFTHPSPPLDLVLVPCQRSEGAPQCCRLYQQLRVGHGEKTLNAVFRIDDACTDPANYVAPVILYQRHSESACVITYRLSRKH